MVLPLLGPWSTTMECGDKVRMRLSYFLHAATTASTSSTTKEDIDAKQIGTPSHESFYFSQIFPGALRMAQETEE
jgi:hypothetical protein